MQRSSKTLPEKWSPYPWALKYIRDISGSNIERTIQVVLDKLNHLRPDVLLSRGINHPRFTNDTPIKVLQILCNDEESTWMRVSDQMQSISYIQLVAVPNAAKFGTIVNSLSAQQIQMRILKPTITTLAENHALLQYKSLEPPLWMHLRENRRLEKFLTTSTIEERTSAGCFLFKELLNSVLLFKQCKMSHGFIRPTSIFLRLGKLAFSTFSRASFAKSATQSRQDLLDCIRLVRFFLTGHFEHTSRTLQSMVLKSFIVLLHDAESGNDTEADVLKRLEAFISSNFPSEKDADVSFTRMVDKAALISSDTSVVAESEFLTASTPFEQFVFSLRRAALQVGQVGFSRGSIFMPENPSVCEDVMRHVFDHCDSFTIQKTALSIRSFLQTSWSLISQYTSSTELRLARSERDVLALQRIAESCPHLATLNVGRDDDPHQPLLPQIVSHTRKMKIFLRDNRYFAAFANVNLSNLRRLHLILSQQLSMHGDNKLLQLVIQSFSVKPNPNSSKILRIDLTAESEQGDSIGRLLPVIKAASGSLDMVYIDRVEAYPWYSRPNWRQIIPAELTALPADSIVEKLKQAVLDSTGLPLSKIRVSGRSVASWYCSDYKGPQTPAAIDAICAACFPSDTRQSAAERAQLYWNIIKDSQVRTWSYQDHFPHALLDWAYLRLDELDPFEEIDGSPAYREVVTNVILQHAVLRLSHLGTELGCSRDLLMKHTIALYLEGKVHTPENPLEKIEKYPKLTEALKIWSESMTIAEFLEHILPDIKKPDASLTDEEIESWSGYILDAYDIFYQAFEKALKVLEAAPEALSVILTSLFGAGLEMVSMIFALPYERRKLVLDPNLTHETKRLWHYLLDHPDLLDQVFSDPAFDPYRASSDGNLVNHLLREGRLTKPEILRVVLQLLDTDDAGGWDGSTFPNRPENVQALLKSPAAVLNLARCAKQPEKFAVASTTIRTMKDNPELMPMMKQLLDMYYQLHLGVAVPPDLLRAIGEKIYSKGWRSITVRKHVAEQFGHVPAKKASSNSKGKAQLSQSTGSEIEDEPEANELQSSGETEPEVEKK